MMMGGHTTGHYMKVEDTTCLPKVKLKDNFAKGTTYSTGWEYPLKKLCLMRFSTRPRLISLRT